MTELPESLFSRANLMTLSIIDTHQHLWDLQQLELPWLGDVPKLNRTFDQQDYQSYTQCTEESEFSYEIGQTLYMEVDVSELDIRKETDLILALCRDASFPQAGMIAAARPESPDFRESLEYASSNPEIKGFRRVLHTNATPKGTCLTPDFLNSIKAMGNQSLTFDVCIRREELIDVTKLAENCAGTQFILDHCGNAEANMNSSDFGQWKDSIQSIAACDNVACKVSGFVWTIQDSDWSYEKDIEPILKVVFDAFGEDRVLFGGDWPVCTLSLLSFQQWLNSIHRFATGFGSNTATKLFSDNAIKFYSL